MQFNFVLRLQAVGPFAKSRIRRASLWCWCPGGYLANLSPSLFQQALEQELPEALTGAEFIRQYGDHGDHATVLQPEVR
jgi:hypothetical protein